MTRRTFLAGTTIALAAQRIDAYPPNSKNVVCVGDSLTYGYTYPSGAQQAANYPALLTTLLFPKGVVTNYGASGRFLGPWGFTEPAPGTMVSLGSTAGGTTGLASIDSLKSNTLQNVVVLMGGSNDCAQEHDPEGARGWKAGFSRFCADRKIAGWDKVVVVTMAARNWPYKFVAVESVRRSFNSYVRNASGYDILIDVAADARYSDCTDTRFFQADQIHWSPALNQITAELIATQLNALNRVLPNSAPRWLRRPK